MESSGQIDTQEQDQPDVVLALSASPINFLHLELLPHELNALDSHKTDNETFQWGM
jgi:hypothetical protein